MLLKKLRNIKLKKEYLVYLVLIVAIVTLGARLNVFEQTLKVINTATSSSKLTPIYYVETEEKKVAISFDAAWGAERTPDILETLRENDIKTTFFLTGFWVEKYPDMVKKIAEEGHEIGNHTYTHPHLNTLEKSSIKEEVSRVHNQIKQLTERDATLFRPPFGEYSNKVIETLKEENYSTIQWSIDSLDWKDLTKEQITERVVSQVHNGAIVLFHNNGLHTAAALPEIISQIEENGFEIVPIFELLHKDNYYIDSSSGAQKLKE